MLVCPPLKYTEDLLLNKTTKSFSDTEMHSTASSLGINLLLCKDAARLSGDLSSPGSCARETELGLARSPAV